MVRRAVSLLLIVFQLSWPGLTVAHAHADAEQTPAEEHGTAQPLSHSSKFHVHFLPFGCSHHHNRHEHEEGDDADTADTEDNRSHDENPQDSSSPIEGQHDDNAFYGDLAYALSGQASVLSTHSTSNLFAWLHQTASVCLPSHPSDNLHTPERAPPDQGKVCAPSPLYLFTFHLLI
ncbi:MAG: hypothetical protein HY000_22095 [Planctomycetes bacterium]|nr:hypothetical protein [Planctomycetota bacterium]